jgi:hypothetical protein
MGCCDKEEDEGSFNCRNKNMKRLTSFFMCPFIMGVTLAVLLINVMDPKPSHSASVIEVKVVEMHKN